MKLARVIATSMVVKVMSVKGGWTEIQSPDGKSTKCRNKVLQMLTDQEVADIAAIVAPVAQKTVDPDLTKYVTHKVKTPSGRKAVDINDKVADILRGEALEDCYFIVAKHVATSTQEDAQETPEQYDARVDKVEKDMREKYKKLNPGMQRMNLGNRLRKAIGTYGHLNAHKTNKFGPGL